MCVFELKSILEYMRAYACVLESVSVYYARVSLYACVFVCVDVSACAYCMCVFFSAVYLPVVSKVRSGVITPLSHTLQSTDAAYMLNLPRRQQNKTGVSLIAST